MDILQNAGAPDTIRDPFDFSEFFRHAAQRSASSAANYGRCKMPIGRNKGKLFKEIPPDELESTRWWIKKTFGADGGTFKDLLHNINKYLEQEGE